MQKTAAVIQILFILFIIGFGTVELFRGNFAASMATLPLLVIYYLFITARHKGR